MREILFRGKRIDNGAWVEGGVISVDLDTYSEREKEKYTHCIIKPKTEFYRGDLAEFNFVIPETIGEFTGMTDINGKKIFEGDIVHVKSFNMRGSLYTDSNFSVTAKFGAWWLLRENKHVQALAVWKCFCEVIGNVHDNPELLQEVQK